MIDGDYESNAPSPMNRLLDESLVSLALKVTYNPIGISKSLD